MRSKDECAQARQEEEKKLNDLLGEDWNTSRAKLYITTFITSLRDGIREAEKKNEFEKALHVRVEAALAKARIEKE